MKVSNDPFCEKEKGKRLSAISRSESSETTGELNYNVVEEQMEVFRALCRRQNQSRHFNKEASHLWFRPNLVRWLEAQASRFTLSFHSVSIALALVDNICARFHFPSSDWHLLAGASLMVASKLVERPKLALTLSTTIELLDGSFSENQVRTVEVSIASALEFRVNVVVPLDFFEFLIGLKVLTDEDWASQPDRTLCVQNIGHQLLQACQHSYDLLQFTSLAVAASVVWIAQKECQVEDPWPESFADLVCVRLEQLNPCILHILEIVENKSVTPVSSCCTERDQTCH